MAKKADKAVKDLAKEVKKLRKDNEKLAKSLEKVRQDGVESRREILAAVKDGLAARETVTTEAPEVQESDGKVEQTTEAATEPEPEVTDAAKRRAKELDVDLADVKGSGSGGRVLVKDVEAAAG